MLKKITIFFSVILLSGCSQLFPAVTKYEPPKNINDIAKIRLMGNPFFYSIKQKNDSDALVGGFVVERNRFVNLGFASTVDRGFPKIQGKNYNGKYFETFVVAERKTEISYRDPNCSVTLSVTPKKDGIYEIHYSDSDWTGHCVLYMRPIVFDEINAIYIEGRN